MTTLTKAARMLSSLSKSRFFHCIEKGASPARIGYGWRELPVGKGRSKRHAKNKVSWALPVLTIKSNYLDHWLNNCNIQRTYDVLGTYLI